MKLFSLPRTLLLHLFLLVSVVCDFNPFDSDLFSIDWAGPREKMLGEDENLEVVNVQTAEDEKYQCIIPESQASKDATRKANYQGATPDELMEKLFQQDACSYRIESYWTYELCHGRHIKQYHENKEMGLQKPKFQQYFLGKGDFKKKKTPVQIFRHTNFPPRLRRYQRYRNANAKDKHTPQTTPETGEEKEESKEPEEPTEEEPAEEKTPQPIPVMKLDGLELPYFSVNMTGGTKCDLTGQPRKSHVMYVCQTDGRGEIFMLKETSSCEYDIIVLTSVLCSHPEFKPKDPPVNEIKCHSVGESPWRPKHLQKQEGEEVLQKSDDITIEVSSSGSSITQTKQPPPQQVPQKQTPPKKPDTTIGPIVDKQLLREFLNGEYCLHGGGGWWKHEFCYGRHAKQYHSDQNGQIDIILGTWNKGKHIQWLTENPGKKPKDIGNRKQLSLYYSGGDICDLTGKTRYVEVKLKCLNKPQQPHAVSIYLIEPKPCEYILGVESPIFCDLFDQADDHGLLDHIKV